MTDNMLSLLRCETERELLENILPFWMERAVDPLRGGFLGRIDGAGNADASADKGAVLNSRILWTFSAAYRRWPRSEFLEAARRAGSYLANHFVDPRYGGIFWSVSADGEPAVRKKQVYAQAFAIYGFSEYFRATRDDSARELARSLFLLLERYARDPEFGGYCEAFSEEWMPIEDMRLSEKDLNIEKSMNTNLHVMEAYVNLYRIWPDPLLRQRIMELTEVLECRIFDARTNHLGLFFDRRWNRADRCVSYGHDIEASWLLQEALEQIGCWIGEGRSADVVGSLARNVFPAIQPDGSLIYESGPEGDDLERHWWVQAENVVGMLNLYATTGDPQALSAAWAQWCYIRRELIDRQHGEWFWSRRPDGSASLDEDKAGLWKCPYHNGRMCMEVIERTDRLLEKRSKP